MIIAIDGPAGSGKSTISKRVADRLKFYHLDTGAMYRAITYAVKQKGIDFQNEAEIVSVARGCVLEFVGAGRQQQKILLNGSDVSREIRDPAVTNNVQYVAKLSAIREQLVGLQRKLAEGKNVVLEGRDTTTVVFPDADFKIYLDANQRERAQRRYIELQEKGVAVTFEEVLSDQKKRDESDFTREVGPLKIAHGATVIDTTGLSIEDVVNRIVMLVKGKSHDWRLFYHIGKTVCVIVGKLLFSLKMYGSENIPKSGSFLIAANHASYLDPGFAGCLLKRHVHFFARDTLFQVPVLGLIISGLNCHKIKRGTADKGALAYAEKLVKSGKGVVLFPEGTRSVDGSIKDAKFGIGFIATRTCAPVIPCYIHNSYKALPKGAKKINRVPISIHYGKALYFSLPLVRTAKKSREYYEEATAQIMDAIKNLREEVLRSENHMC
jgi:CMP/dCMP kinase